MPKRDRGRLDPEEVLRGRVRPGATALCALVRAVNPSDLGLPAVERERRYALKSRLQSLLVERFHDEIEVVRDGPPGSDIVLLRHRPSGEAAGHAVLAELDEEARSRVRRTLDVEESEVRATAGSPSARRDVRGRPTRGHPREPERAGPPARAETVDELLTAGRRAAADYDYEGARSAFEAALARSGGAIGPAVSLLDLLVEQLGADEDALAVERSLSAAALGDLAVRGKLAVAAARSGAREKALSLARGLRDDAAAEVIAALARSALAASDLASAARDLAELRRQGPAHGELRAMEDALEAARRPLFRPVEEELISLVAAGRFDEAELLARALPAGMPRSEAVRGALRAIDDHKRRARVAEALVRAESALASGDPMTAIGLLRHVQAGDPEIEKARVAEVLSAAEAAERARADAAAAEGVSGLLGRGDLVEGLVAYAGLSPEARALVRGRAPRSELEVLDQIGAGGTGVRARAAALAALAVTRADAIAGSDPDGASALLRSHARELQGAHAAQQIAVKIDLARRERGRAEARRRFVEAHALLASVGLEGGQRWAVTERAKELAEVAARARELLSDATLDLLEGADRERAAALRGAVDSLLERTAFFGRLWGLVDRADVAGARAFLEAALANTPPKSDDPEWRDAIAAELRESMEQGIQARFRVCVAGEGARDLARRGLGRAVVTDEAMTMPDLWGVSYSRMGGAERCIVDRQLVQFQSCGDLAFLRVIDLEGPAPRLRRTAIFRTPQPAGCHSGDADREKVVAVGLFGAMLTVSITDFRVLTWRPPVPPHAGAVRHPEFAPPWYVQASVASPDLRFAWNLETPPEAPAHIRVVDTATLRLVHEERADPTGMTFEALLGVPGIEVAVLGPSSIDLRRVDGAPVRGGRFDLAPARASVTACPGGGVFALVRESGSASGPYGAVRLLPGAPAPAPAIIEGLPGEHVLSVVADLAGGRVFLLHDAGGERFLTALRAEESGFVRLFQARVPCRSMLVLDVESHRPSLLAVTRRAFDVLPLGAEPPRLPEAPDMPFVVVPRVRQFGLRCHEIDGPRPDAVQRWVREIDGATRGEVSRLTRRLVKQNDPDALCDFARALESGNHVVDALEIINFTAARHPHHILVRLHAARPFANIGLWGKVRELLAGQDDAGLDAAAARHFGHLLGLALLDAGHHDEARRVLLRALEHEGRCQIESLIAVASPLADEGDDIPERRAMRELLRVVAAADARLSEEDAPGAIELLDEALVWEAREVQSMARFARAFLSAGDDLPPALQIRKLFVLATYAELHEDLTSNRREIFLKDRWSVETLDSLRAEAAAWVEAFASRASIEEPSAPTPP